VIKIAGRNFEKPKVTPNIITPHDVDAVLQYLPYFADPTNKFYEIDKGSFSEPSVINIEPFIYSQKVSEFITTLYHCNFIQEFDWTSYDETEKYKKHPILIGDADLEIIIKLLTTHVRADRFCSGHLASVLDNGYLLKILQRLAEIRKETSP
jgi:O-acetyl-ADP-ribose deacetylase